MATESSSPVEITSLVKDQVGNGLATVLTASKMVQHLLSPASVRVRGQLENQATAVAVALAKIAAQLRRAIEIFSCLVEDQPGTGGASVPPCECVAYFLFPASVRVRGQLENHATAIAAATGIAARVRRAIQTPFRIEHQTALRIIAVAAVRDGAEAIECALRPASVLIRRQLENHATAVAAATGIAARLRRAIQTPFRVEHQTALRTKAVAAIREGAEVIEHTLRPASLRVWR